MTNLLLMLLLTTAMMMMMLERITDDFTVTVEQSGVTRPGSDQCVGALKGGETGKTRVTANLRHGRRAWKGPL
ncbi:unnamed protein product [Lampetra planeri]